MLRTNSLIKQIKRACQTVRADASPASQYLLALVDSVLNEFARRENPEFYVEHIRIGSELLERARAKASGDDATLPEVPAPAHEQFHGDLRHDVLAAEIGRIEQGLADVTANVDLANDDDAVALVEEICGWSASLWIHRVQPADPVEDPPIITRDSFEAYLKRRFPEIPDLAISAFNVLDGGYSKQTIFVETSAPVEGHSAVVVRAEQPVSLLIGWDGSDITKEVDSIRLVRQAGIPVPEVLWLEDDASQAGSRFIVSPRAEGQRLGASLGSDVELAPELIDSVMELLHKTHSIDIHAHKELAASSHLAEWLDFSTVEECTEYMVHGYLDKMIERSDVRTTPAMVRGIQWLRDNIPACDEPPVFLHLDFALNNMLFDGNEVTALLDWETSRLGDPADDLNWTQQNLAQYITMPELLDRYEAMLGRRVSEYRLAYARIVRCILNMNAFQRSLECLDREPDTNLNLFTLAIDFPGLLGAELTGLIQAAEAAR